jgi:Leucine-rich repeat (LRR) protein
MQVDGINGFKSMQVFVLANCLLTGIIPPWLQGLLNINLLDLSWNKLNGNIPPWLGNLKDLFYLDLSNNSFSEVLPMSFTQMRSLISINGLNEQSPREGLPLFFKKNSTSKVLQYNQVSSFLPSLRLSNNLLVGPILSSFGHLVNLHVLDLSCNNFSGPIPYELSNMSNLEMLNLAYNDLNGSIPSSLTKLNFLSEFDVLYNNLSGDIPTGVSSQLFQMRILQAILGSALYGTPVINRCNQRMNTNTSTPRHVYFKTNHTHHGGSRIFWGAADGLECTVFCKVLEVCVF